MTGNEYQKLAERTYNKALDDNGNLACGSLGLVGEAGEAVDAIKKHLFHGHSLDAEHVAKELGDVLWYIASLCTTLGVSLDYVMDLNIKKLERRYPSGFSSQASIGRKDQ